MVTNFCCIQAVQRSSIYCGRHYSYIVFWTERWKVRLISWCLPSVFDKPFSIDLLSEADSCFVLLHDSITQYYTCIPLQRDMFNKKGLKHTYVCLSTHFSFLYAVPFTKHPPVWRHVAHENHARRTCKSRGRAPETMFAKAGLFTTTFHYYYFQQYCKQFSW